MRGHIRSKGKGSWQIQIYTGPGPDGRPRRHFEMLLRGAKPKVISEALGHSSVAFTRDTYSHIIGGVQEDAMALRDGVLPAAASPKNNANLTLKVDIRALKPKDLASMPA